MVNGILAFVLSLPAFSRSHIRLRAKTPVNIHKRFTCGSGIIRTQLGYACEVGGMEIESLGLMFMGKLHSVGHRAHFSIEEYHDLDWPHSSPTLCDVHSHLMRCSPIIFVPFETRNWSCSSRLWLEGKSSVWLESLTQRMRP